MRNLIKGTSLCSLSRKCLKSVFFQFWWFKIKKITRLLSLLVCSPLVNYNSKLTLFIDTCDSNNISNNYYNAHVRRHMSKTSLVLIYTFGDIVWRWFKILHSIFIYFFLITTLLTSYASTKCTVDSLKMMYNLLISFDLT